MSNEALLLLDKMTQKVCSASFETTHEQLWMQEKEHELSSGVFSEDDFSAEELAEQSKQQKSKATEIAAEK